MITAQPALSDRLGCLAVLTRLTREGPAALAAAAPGQVQAARLREIGDALLAPLSGTSEGGRPG